MDKCLAEHTKQCDTKVVTAVLTVPFCILDGRIFFFSSVKQIDFNTVLICNHSTVKGWIKEIILHNLRELHKEITP